MVKTNLVNGEGRSNGRAGNGSGIKPLMSVRPVLPPEAARHLFAHDEFDYGMGPGPPPMFPSPHGRMCLPPGPRQPMRRAPPMYPVGHMGHGPPPFGHSACGPPQLPPLFNRNVTEQYRRPKRTPAKVEKKSNHGKKNDCKPSNKQGSETEKPWVNEAIVAEILLKHKLQQTARRSRGANDWNGYREQRNKVTAMLRAAKMEWTTAQKAREANGSADESSLPGNSSSSPSESQDSDIVNADTREEQQTIADDIAENDSEGESGDDDASEDTKPAMNENVNADAIVDGISGDNSPGSAKE